MFKVALSQLPTSLLALIFISHLSQAQLCYSAAYGLLAEVGWNACPGTSTTASGAESCCMNTSDCGPDGLCRSIGADGSYSWYQAGCTDSSFDDPICRKNCVNYSATFVQWLSGAQEWACCGNNVCNGTTTDDTFSAVSPQDWKQITGVQTSTIAAISTSSATVKTPQTTSLTQTQSTQHATSTSTAVIASSVSSAFPQTTQTTRTKAHQSSVHSQTSGRKAHQTQTSGSASPTNEHAISVSSSSSAPASDSQSRSSGLSTGAKAGIGVAIAVATLALIAAVIAIMLLRKNRRKRNEIEEVYEKRAPESFTSVSTVPPSYQQAVEIGETEPAIEMPTDNSVHEMPSNHDRWSKMR